MPSVEFPTANDLQLAQLVCVWLGLSLVSGLGLFLVWRARDRWSWTLSDGLAMAGLAGLALGLRLAASPWSVIHENAHGYEYLRQVFSCDGYFFHGAAYPAFFHLWSAIFGDRPAVVFAVNAGLGALSAVLLVPLGRRLLDSRPAAWLAALGAAVWPAAVRLGGSESMFPLAVAAAMAAWWAWLRAFETGSTARFLFAAALLVVAVQARPEVAVWALGLPASLALVPGWTKRLRGPGPWLALALGAILCAPWAIFRWQVLSAEGLPGFIRPWPLEVLTGLWARHHLLVRGDWTPLWLWLFAPLGLAALWVHRPRALLALAVAFAAAGWLSLGIATGESSSVRLQSLLQPIALLAAGSGAAWFANLVGPHWRWSLLALLGLWLSVACLARLTKASEVQNPQFEWRFLEAQVPKLPGDCALVVADRFMADRVISTEFPEWWAEGREVLQWSDYRSEVAAGRPPVCAIWYRGLTCYLFTHLERPPADGLRPECRLPERDHQLVPLIEAQAQNRPDTAFRIPSSTLTLGLYRMIPRSSD